MRELKFRAWAIKQNEMITNPNLCIVIIQKELGEFIPMQYTGLKDKNNKDIYEGDILRYDGFRDWLISWHEAGFYLQNFFRGIGSTDYFILTHELAITREIIGNIYKNKELLNG